MRCSGGRDLLSCRAFALHRCSRSLYILYGIHGIHELTSCSGNRTQDMDWNRFISNRLWSGDRQIISKFPFASFGAISHHHVSDLKHQPRDAFEITEEERQQDAERWAEFRASLAAKICQDIVVHLLCAAWFWYVLVCVCVCDLPYRAWSHEESPFAIQGKKEAERKQMEEERRKAFEESERKWAEEEAKKKKAEERKVKKVKVRDPEEEDDEEEDDEAGLVMLWDAAFVKVLGSNVAGDHTQTTTPLAFARTALWKAPQPRRRRRRRNWRTTTWRSAALLSWKTSWEPWIFQSQGERQSLSNGYVRQNDGFQRWIAAGWNALCQWMVA